MFYKEYRNVSRALDAFARADGDRYLNKHVRDSIWFTSTVPIEVINGEIQCTKELTGNHWRRVYRNIKK